MSTRDYLNELKERVPQGADRSGLLRAAKCFVQEKKDELHRMHRDGAGGAVITARYTSLVDALITSLYSVGPEHARRAGSHALAALGGYGREELCFHSDIDIMFLHSGRLDKAAQDANDYLLYFLWDLGFEVGHSVRSIREALRLAKRDDTILTSMLESRVLAGDVRTYEAFIHKLFAQIRAAGIRHFIRRKERERARAYRLAGGEVYHDQPNIKETAGGLRDYHTGVWIALARYGLKSCRDFFNAGLLPEDKFLKIEKALDFMWRVRNQLFFEDGPHDDVLTPRRQERIAEAFAYPTTRAVLGVELFMQDYYIHANELHRFYQEMLRLAGLPEKRRRTRTPARSGTTERGLRIVRQAVYLPEQDSNWFRENPARLIEVIWYSQKRGLQLSDSAADFIRRNLDLVDDAFRISPVARDYFMAILSDTARVGATMRLMSELGILDRYFPEFAAVKHLLWYDEFHQYPVHEHTLRALENLAAIPHLTELGTDTLKKILHEIGSPEILSLAIFLHDLGKTERGSHVEEGVAIADQVGRRLALTEPHMETLTFLIRNHLMMTHLSQYRDLDDAEVIRSFASEVGTEERLNMLYLLTFADLYAVRQGAWNDWKSALLHQLYHSARQMLKGPEPGTREHEHYWNTPKAHAVSEYLPHLESAAVRKHLKLMSRRYFDSFPPQEIAEHVQMALSLRRQTAAFKCEEVPAYSLSKVTVCANDKLGLFAEIAGSFASQQVSVISAAVFTRADGIAIDSFYVLDEETDGPLSPTKWELVRETLRRTLRGERDVGALVRQVERIPRVARRTMSSLRRGVFFDNRVSATHTVIDIEAPDRIGLLYDIASTLSALGLNISVAKIATDVRQARDAFYVTDAEGNKIEEPLRIHAIRESIEKALGGTKGESPSDADKEAKPGRRVKAT
ncbi:MAG: [protein-PII] uridylyltransferase [Candidatus Abyssubacteria bacterium]